MTEAKTFYQLYQEAMNKIADAWVIMVIIGVAGIILLFAVMALTYHQKECFTPEAREAMQKYGPAMDGSMCLDSCQKMANAENRSVECGCACDCCRPGGRCYTGGLWGYIRPQETCLYDIKKPGGRP